MEQRIKEDILAVLEKAIIALRKDSHPNHALSLMSNEVIHNATIYQDHDSVSVAILIYALSKILQRACEKGCPNYEHIAEKLQRAYDALADDDHEGFESRLQAVFSIVQKMDSKVKLYVQEIFDKARIKKGTKLHEHGISIARIAEMTGVSQWELMDYMGKTMMLGDTVGVDVKKRLATARSLFR